MVRLEKHGDSAVRFIFTDSDHYLYKDGVVDVPVNSLSLVIDESEMVTFKKASTGDPFISFRLDKSNFSSRDELLTFYKENMVGAGGISEEEVQEMIDAATSGMPSSEVVEQLRRDVNAVSGEVDTKQDILTAGENITISGNVISADNNIIELTQAEYDALETKDPEVLYIITDAQEINMNDYYTKSEVDASIATKADASALTAVNNALTAHTADTTVHVTQVEKDAWNAKADASAITSIESDITAVSNNVDALSGAVIDNEYTVSQAINELKSTKLDASAYTPTDLSQYWTSAQTQTAIDGVKAYFIDLDTIMQSGLTDADWDGAIAAVNAHRPVYIKFYNNHYILESYSLTDNNNTMYLSASDGIAASRFTIIKNGSNDYSLQRNIRSFATDAEMASWNAKVDASALTTVNNALTAHTADTTVHVTQAEKETWNRKQNGLTAGRGLFINADNTISAPTAVLGQGGTVGVMQIVKLTQAAYDALSTKDAQTLYIVVD